MNERDLLTELDACFSKPRDSFLRREETAFDEAAGPLGSSLVLFGAGGLGRKTRMGLQSLGLEPLAFADNSPRLWNSSMEGVPVLRPEEAARRFGRTAVFVVCVWRSGATERLGDLEGQLVALGIQRVTSFVTLFCKYPELFLPYWAIDLPHRIWDSQDAVRAAARLWADDRSRAEYLAQVRWRLLLDFAGLPDPVAEEIYFPDDLFRVGVDEIFVDCGAYDGDTIRSFLTRCPGFRGRIYAFEPDPSNRARLDAYISGLPEPLRRRMFISGKAVGSRRERVSFDALGTASSTVGSGTLEVESVTLDEELREDVPTYIKVDTEGAEPDVLGGASATVRRHAPKMALSVYHRQRHLWEIPEQVWSYSDRYRFYLRSYCLEGWDLVCYCMPTTRRGAQ